MICCPCSTLQLLPARSDSRSLRPKMNDSEYLQRANAAALRYLSHRPRSEAEVDIMYSEGISRFGELIDVGVEEEVVKKSGAFYSFGDTRLGQGRENSKAFLKEHPELSDEIDGLIRASLNPPPVESGETNGVSEETLEDDSMPAVAVSEEND